MDKKTRDLIHAVLNEWIFALTSVALVTTSIAFRRIPRYSLSDFKVLYTLFVFLVTVKGLERSGLFRSLSLRISRGRFIPQKLMIMTAILSMTVTNDVALFIMIPLTAALDIENRDLMIIAEALVTNASSFLTPFGNPQNMFIYYHYNLSPASFLKAVYAMSLITTLIVFPLSFFVKMKKPVIFKRSEPFKGSSITYAVFFVIFTLAVFKILPLWVGLITLIYTTVFDRKSLKIDYFLLATFFSFFGLTDNLISIINITLKSSKEVFLISALSSQVISNVPAALLFADFTKDWKALLLGVNIGGFGTLFGSMANLIAYRIYVKSRGPGRFLLKFHIYSLSMFFFGIFLYFLLYSR